VKSKSPWWVRFLAVVGATALCTIAIAFFTALGRRPSVYHVTEAPRVDDPDFLASLSGAMGTPVRSGGTAQLLNNGVQFFPAMLEAIRRARKTVNFTAYIWEPGSVSDEFFAALTERARAGVQVRLLLDGMGGRSAPREGIAALRAAGGRVERFRPPRFGQLTRFHKRTHRRAIVIDGLVGFTGGAAVADKWQGDAEGPEHWRDTMVHFTGPPAVTLQTAFVSLWAPVAGELLSGPDFFPTLPEDPGGLRHLGVASSPSADDHPLRLFYLQSMLAARRRLYLTTPYFVPDDTVRATILARAKAGVDVRVLLPNEYTDADPIRLASHRHYEELLAGGVRVYEYQPTMMHAKGLVVDGRWSVVGSPNMDIRSHELNQENLVGVLDEAFAAQLEKTFLRDLESAREIRLAEWSRRGRGVRLLERACALFAEQY
jgi:cardiolipin synthase A/B